jgi:hypothetical protein
LDHPFGVPVMRGDKALQYVACQGDPFFTAIPLFWFRVLWDRYPKIDDIESHWANGILWFCLLCLVYDLTNPIALLYKSL